VAPLCSNCGGTEFVWANEVKTGSTGGSLSLRAKGEVPIGTRICKGCGHADLFLHDLSILHKPHLWMPGEFYPISGAKPAEPAPAPPAGPTPEPAPILAPAPELPVAPAPPPPPEPTPAPGPASPSMSSSETSAPETGGDGAPKGRRRRTSKAAPESTSPTA